VAPPQVRGPIPVPMPQVPVVKPPAPRLQPDPPVTGVAVSQSPEKGTVHFPTCGEGANSSVAYPGCLSRIRLFSIPDPHQRIEVF